MLQTQRGGGLLKDKGRAATISGGETEKNTLERTDNAFQTVQFKMACKNMFQKKRQGSGPLLRSQQAFTEAPSYRGETKEAPGCQPADPRLVGTTSSQSEPTRLADPASSSLRADAQ